MTFRHEIVKGHWMKQPARSVCRREEEGGGYEESLFIGSCMAQNTPAGFSKESIERQSYGGCGHERERQQRTE